MRSYPFGYRMVDGEFVIHEVEKDIVVDIFNMYLQNMSLQKIADEMSIRGIKYHDEKNFWNKNMVSRILQNRQYVSQEKYPQIITINIFTAVLEKKKVKTNSHQNPCKINAIKHMLYCGKCGAKISRRTSNRGKERWYCVSDRAHISVKISDDIIAKSLRTTILNHEISPIQKSDVSDPHHITNLNREIDNLVQMQLNDSEIIKEMIIKVATERYAVCENGIGESKLKQLILAKIKASNEIIASDLEQIAERILLNFNGEVIIMERK